MEDKYADLASQMEELQQKLTSEVLATAVALFVNFELQRGSLRGTQCAKD